MLQRTLLSALLLAVTMQHASGSEDEPVRSMIDLTNAEMVRVRRPILIAHRGGVITPTSPECTRAAIELAARQGYDMIELDVQETKDHIPVVFHDRDLQRACGVEGRVADLTVQQVTEIHHLANQEPIATLAEALKLCKSLQLGIMLDVKSRDGSDRFFEHIVTLINDVSFPNAVVTISGHPGVRSKLDGIAMLTVTSEEFKKVRDGERVPLKGRFWFGLPENLPKEMVGPLHENGALVIPAINTFRYPSDNHMDLAREDIQELMDVQVDGFQIDSVYGDFVNVNPKP